MAKTVSGIGGQIIDNENYTAPTAGVTWNKMI